MTGDKSPDTATQLEQLRKTRALALQLTKTSHGVLLDELERFVQNLDEEIRQLESRSH